MAGFREKRGLLLQHARRTGEDRLADELTGVGDLAGKGAGRGGQGARQVDAGFFVTHAAREVAVGGAVVAVGSTTFAKDGSSTACGFPSIQAANNKQQLIKSQNFFIF